MRYYSYPLKWLLSKRHKDKCWPGHRGTGTLKNFWWERKSGRVMSENSLAVSFKVKLTVKLPWLNLLFNQVIPLLGTNHGEMKTCPHKDLNMNVHSRITYNGWNLETIQMFISWWINKQCGVAYPHNEIQFSNVKEQTTDESQNKRLPILWFHL